ncbi:ATP-grasp domain-containing protein [Micromonospora sp. R77]|uniref:ATP-grasp domain-containing protein n=1 Tax=Micromonospora sp. R77 TaxID=2925836 RepID=UPI001F60CB2A|nr:ATP-grasp domain-containing protein [Micromonospora sp. R77]MCI4066885.1 ATP-grasp domain-containing protein [Micromonospora sp. R77]
MSVPSPGTGLFAVVDGYSAGRFLPPAFDRAGAAVLHVRSTPAWLACVPVPDLRPYVGTLVHDGTRRTVARLAERGVAGVVAGQETGVPLADELAERLRLPGNGTRHSAARRDKFRMIETVRAAGLHCARQWKATDGPALAASATADGCFPYVVKPLRSASSDGVTVCRTAAEVRAAADRILGTTDLFAEPNTEVLMQSYLDGTEYVVDVVLRDGARHVCGVWRYDKPLRGGRRLYDKDILVDPDEAPVPELIAYVDRVLAALDIRHGAAHAEVMLTAQGPALVEIGARLNGNMDPGFHDLCLGANQADLTALAYARPDDFVRRYGGTVYRPLRAALVHNAATSVSGRVEAVDEDVVATIAALPTVRLVTPRLGPGDPIRPTVDLITSTLRVHFAGDSLAEVLADHRRVVALSDRVYRLADPARPVGSR